MNLILIELPHKFNEISYFISIHFWQIHEVGSWLLELYHVSLFTILCEHEMFSI